MTTEIREAVMTEMTRRELLDYHIGQRDMLKKALEPAEMAFGYVSPDQRVEADARRNEALDFHERVITWLVEGDGGSAF